MDLLRRSVLTVCGPDRQGAAIDHRRRHTLLHELAHVWDHATLTAADRQLLLPVLAQRTGMNPAPDGIDEASSDSPKH